MNAPAYEREQAAPCLTCRRLIVWTVKLDCARDDCEAFALERERHLFYRAGVR